MQPRPVDYRLIKPPPPQPKYRQKLYESVKRDFVNKEPELSKEQAEIERVNNMNIQEKFNILIKHQNKLKKEIKVFKIKTAKIMKIKLTQQNDAQSIR